MFPMMLLIGTDNEIETKWAGERSSAHFFSVGHALVKIAIYILLAEEYNCITGEGVIYGTD